MIGSDTIRGYSDAIILHILLSGDNYGYDISRRVSEGARGKFTMKETTLYSAFARLQKNGHVTSYGGDETYGRRRNYYSITPAGRVYYEEKCREWQLSKEVIDVFLGGQ